MTLKYPNLSSPKATSTRGNISNRKAASELTVLKEQVGLLMTMFPVGMFIQMPYKVDNFVEYWPYLLCEGGRISCIEHATLYGVIGDTYTIGTADGVTFGLPDALGRPLVGAGLTTGPAIGTNEGNAVGLRKMQVNKHYHTNETGASALKINSSGAHTTAIDHNHPAQSTGWTNNGAVVEFNNGGTDSGAMITAGGNRLAWSRALFDHMHDVDIDPLTGNSTSNGAHPHAATDFAGAIGSVAAGSNGDTDMKLPYLAAYIYIKYR